MLTGHSLQGHCRASKSPTRGSPDCPYAKIVPWYPSITPAGWKREGEVRSGVGNGRANRPWRTTNEATTGLTLDHRACRAVEDLLLGRISVKNVIKVKVEAFEDAPRGRNSVQWLFGHDCRAFADLQEASLVAPVSLRGQERPDATVNLYVPLGRHGGRPWGVWPLQAACWCGTRSNARTEPRRNSRTACLLPSVAWRRQACVKFLGGECHAIPTRPGFADCESARKVIEARSENENVVRSIPPSTVGALQHTDPRKHICWLQTPSVAAHDAIAHGPQTGLQSPAPRLQLLCRPFPRSAECHHASRRLANGPAPQQCPPRMTSSRPRGSRTLGR